MAKNTTDSAQIRPAFDLLVERHGRELYAYLWRLLGDRQDAEDCLQDTFLRALRAHERTNSDWNYRAWLYKIATNSARKQLKRSPRPAQLPEGLPDPSQRDPLEAIDLQEQVRIVRSAMRQLSIRQRTAIMMRKYSDLDYETIGQVLDCTPETARAHVYQGLRRLRERLVKG